MSDITVPILKGLRFPKTIDLSSGPAKFTVAVDTEDASAISEVTFMLDRPVIRLQFDEGYPERSIDISGYYNNGDTFTDGTPYTAANTITLGTNTSAGTYTFSAVNVWDVAGNVRTYYTSDLHNLGINQTFTVTGTKTDQTGGPLTGLSLQPTLDLSNGHAMFHASAGAVDNAGGNGIAYVMVELDKHIVYEWGTSPYLFIGRNIYGHDTFADGTPESGDYSTVVSSLTAPGTYQVQSAQVVDLSGNTTTYTRDQLAARGFDTGFKIAGNQGDTVKPILEGLQVPTYLDLSKGTQPYTFSAQAGDEGGSGISQVWVYLDRPFVTPDRAQQGILFLNGTADDDFDDATPGSAVHVEQIMPTTPHGTYNINSIWVQDGAANRATYDADQLRDMGIATRFQAGDGTQMEAPTAAATMRLDGDNVIVTMSSQAWKTTDGQANISLTYDPARMHYIGAVAPGATLQGGEANSSTDLGWVRALVHGHTTDSAEVVSMTFKLLSARNNVSFELDQFSIGGQEQRFGGGELLKFQHGGAGDDLLRGGLGNDATDGGAGYDTVRYAMSSSGIEITRSANGFTVTDGKGVHDDLLNVEVIAFTDRAIAYDPEGTAGNVYRLYQAAFDRAADKPGLGYWIDKAEHGASLRSIAAGFMQSAEFKNMYGTGGADSVFLEKLYQHALHRAPDDEGMLYWQHQLHRGATRVDLLLSFADSPENHAQVIGSIRDGIDYVPVA